MGVGTHILKGARKLPRDVNPFSDIFQSHGVPFYAQLSYWPSCSVKKISLTLSHLVSEIL